MNFKEVITIFTPTFNRSKMLKKLYNSLLRQSVKNFIWLIVDDGSTDDTNIIVKKMIDENIIKIKYYYKTNGGKHTAFNEVLKLCNTKYLVCVDSDDFLLDHDVKIINQYINKYLKEDVLGFVFPRKTNKDILKITKKFDKQKIDIMDLKFCTNLNIETSIIMNIKKIKKIQFPVFLNEKFVSEEILYNEFSKIGKFLFINQYVVYSEYLEDGLTKKIYIYYKKSPYSTIELFKSRYFFLKKYKLNTRIINRVKSIINLNALCLSAKINFLSVTPSKPLSILLIPISLLWKVIKYE